VLDVADVSDILVAVGAVQTLIEQAPRRAALNAGPNGIPVNQAAVRWALEHYVGVVGPRHRAVAVCPAPARELAGTYENVAHAFGHRRW
jgi:hypothetical protein